MYALPALDNEAAGAGELAGCARPPPVRPRLPPLAAAFPGFPPLMWVLQAIPVHIKSIKQLISGMVLVLGMVAAP